MRVAGHAYDLMTAAEVSQIHQGALRILDEVGLEVQNDVLLRALADRGLPVEYPAQRVRFPPPFVERFVADADKHDWTQARPRVTGSAGVYHSLYHDPATGGLVPWSEDALAFYIRLPHYLDHVDEAHVLGCPLDVAPPLGPLYERYYCWKYGARESGSIHLDALCPYVLELYAALADEKGLSLEDVFRAAVYLVPPLKLGRHEAYQVAYFRERGLRTHIGDMLAMGASAPVTVAGAVTLNLAEQLALRMLEWGLWGERRLHLSSSVSVMDMRSGVFPYGRPEMAVVNMMTAQMARHYGASFSGHCGLTDAKLPSVESGAQKALTAIPTLLAGGSLRLDAGLLGVDQICSPVQMVLDDEFMGALACFTQEFEVSEESIGLDTILETGPGGHYFDKVHTARRFRGEHWMPRFWSSARLEPWLQGDCQLDEDKARQLALDVGGRPAESPGMSPSLERAVLEIIARAGRALL